MPEPTELEELRALVARQAAQQAELVEELRRRVPEADPPERLTATQRMARGYKTNQPAPERQEDTTDADD